MPALQNADRRIRRPAPLAAVVTEIDVLGKSRYGGCDCDRQQRGLKEREARGHRKWLHVENLAHSDAAPLALQSVSWPPAPLIATPDPPADLPTCMDWPRPPYTVSQQRRVPMNYLEFEKTFGEIEGKAEELRAMARANPGMDVEKEAAGLDKKASDLLIGLYAGLTAWQKCQVARHPDRPHCRTISKLCSPNTPRLPGTGTLPMTIR